MAAAQAPSFVRRAALAEYRPKYTDFFELDRQRGVLHARMHHAQGPARYGLALHDAWSQLWLDVGNDPENEVLVFSGTGDAWIGDIEPAFPTPDAVAATFSAMSAREFHQRLYVDALRLLESFIFHVDIPTIACINGPGIHTEFALLADITLCSQDASIFDAHFPVGLVPGDGQGLTLQALLGPKRAAHLLYSGQPLTAEEALQHGLVNEVTEPDRLVPRALELAEGIMRQPSHVRRLTSTIVKQHWKRRLVDDLGFHLAHELLALRLGAGQPAG